MKNRLFEVNGVVQNFVWIEPGSFLTGINHDVKVILTKGYWLADTTCTQEFWCAVNHNNPSILQSSSDLPVTRVTWVQVRYFIEKLRKLYLSLNIDLPTNAEWWHACIADTKTKFSFGNIAAPTLLNCYLEGEEGPMGRSVPVRSYPPNPWGLYEMHGNVREWCRDSNKLYLPGTTEIDPIGPTRVSYRSINGGSYASVPYECLHTHRSTNHINMGSPDIGFRLKITDT